MTLYELWNNQFRRTAAYISFIANGYSTVIKSAGFPYTKCTRQKRGKIEVIENFSADVQSPKGMAEVSCKSVKGADSYIMLAAMESAKISMSGDDILIDMNGGQVRIKTITQCSTVFTGLPSKTSVNICMLAFNIAGSSPLTEAQTITPQ